MESRRDLGHSSAAMTPEITAAFPAFARLDASALRTLSATARVITLAAGTPVFGDGDPCAQYVLVLDGSIRVQKVAENGREIVLYRVEGGQACVLTTNALITRSDYSAQGIVETQARVLILPASTFRTLLAQSEIFRDFVFAAYATRISDLLMLIEEVAFGRIDLRLAAWLRQHAGGEGVINATHQDIAMELGTAREVISRQLKEFERRGWVALFRGRVELRDSEGMATLARAL